MTHKRARSPSADEEYYEVESVVAKRTVGSGTEYSVKWKGFPSSRNTWEPLSALCHAQSAIDEFEDRQSLLRRVRQQAAAREDVKVVGVRELAGKLLWAVQPLNGAPLFEMPLAEARRRAPQALVDYLVSKLSPEETKSLWRKGQTNSVSRAAPQGTPSGSKEVASVHSHHPSDILLTEDMSTTATGSSKQMTQTQGRSLKHASSDEQKPAHALRSVFEGVNEQDFDVLIDTMLGEGANGQVYRALDQRTGRFLAVKIIKMNLRNDRWKEKLETLEREIRLLRGLDHPNIVRYLGCGKELPEAEPEGYVKIYMEYMAGGSISRMLKEFGAFEEPVVAKFTKQIVVGLQYLHGMGVMHRDLKGGNILVGPKAVVKLADFGASKQIQGLPIVSNNSEICKSIKGSLYWMAPEMFQKVAYGRKVDIWSLGCVVIEMATGKHPWPNIRMQHELCLAIAQRQIPEIPKHVSQTCQDFISLCLNHDINLRPHPTALLRHPFLINAPS